MASSKMWNSWWTKNIPGIKCFHRTPQVAQGWHYCCAVGDAAMRPLLRRARDSWSLNGTGRWPRPSQGYNPSVAIVRWGWFGGTTSSATIFFRIKTTTGCRLWCGSRCSRSMTHHQLLLASDIMSSIRPCSRTSAVDCCCTCRRCVAQTAAANARPQHSTAHCTARR